MIYFDLTLFIEKKQLLYQKSGKILEFFSDNELPDVKTKIYKDEGKLKQCSE